MWKPMVGNLRRIIVRLSDYSTMATASSKGVVPTLLNLVIGDPLGDHDGFCGFLTDLLNLGHCLYQ